ncbi:MAG: precorrin-3B C(17)-methyltransferase [Thermanaeromonas sp.]|uniref:precorrin-3B C(17)-methyltransferase n=1 Tax=Thermanaeromonas sp. TaxID=2003697 RepID=UPI002439E3F3|nr:precorrin-3B C(17)-methyltransferase [Thermanaeromonas sp.]MCG0278717.1 precorrin-3B C(17)-methyltransferase [Thermanaeromonas sp.]
MQEDSLKRGNRSLGQGHISIVGLGPGGPQDMTPRATEALAQAEVVVGYRPYVALLGEMATSKEVVATGMTAEVERCQEAVRRAARGQRVAVVSSGDAGIYGMAGLVLQILHQEDQAGKIGVEVIPGVTAATAAAAALGAPLMHDFAVISLSDRLTPWETIARRLNLAAQGDFVIVLYNPKSQSRTWQLSRAQEIILQYRSPATPVGVVRQAGRPGQQVWISDLASFLSLPVDMLSTVIIGNSQTQILGKWMVTPRGYDL